jgi:predicted amidohydrolase YtcJ
LHVCVLNTAALREAGFADGQPDPPGGAFGRDREGRLDGVVYEAPMFALFEARIRRDIAQADAAGAKIIETAGERLAGFGLTSACDADMRPASFASGSTGWSCTTRWTGSSAPGCRAAIPASWPRRP